MDTASAEPSNLEGALLEELNFITVGFLPLDTTPLIQPMDENVILNIKKLYTKALF